MKILNKSTNVRPIFSEADRSNFEDVYTDFSGNDFLGFSEYPYTIPDLIPEVYYYDTAKEDKLRFDTLAGEFHNTPETWWLLMHTNGIVNPFAVDDNMTLLIPSFVSYMDELRRSAKE